MIVRIASLCLVVATLSGCDCGDLVVALYPAGSGETARAVWRIGDTASVFAEIGYEKSGGDVVCDRYGSRTAPEYHGQVEPDSFTFQSSAPAIVSVTNHGLVTAHQIGQADIRAASVRTGTLSRPLRIAVQN